MFWKNLKYKIDFLIIRFRYQLKDRISLAGVEDDDVDAGLVQQLQPRLVLLAGGDRSADVQLNSFKENQMKTLTRLQELIISFVIKCFLIIDI